MGFRLKKKEKTKNINTNIPYFFFFMVEGLVNESRKSIAVERAAVSARFVLTLC